MGASARLTGGSLDHQLILGRYRPLQDLAQGGYGDVVLAYDTRMQRRVAIKRLPLPRDRGGRAAEPSGLAEARTAAMLGHPNIVTVHEWDTDSDEAFLIMEYVEGPTVADLLDDREGPLDTDEAAAVIEAVSSALEHAHRNGVLHLDVKPDNVLVSRDGIVKVTDFGVAALSHAHGHGAAVGGTPGYMPPEQLRGEPLDERTDVWAFGVLAFEVLAYANPFASESIEGALFKAEIAEPPAPGEFAPGLGPAVDDIVLTATTADPDERYPAVRPFASELLRELGDPATGRELLADAAQDYVAEEPSSALDLERLGLWDRLVAHPALALRPAAAVVAGWFAWAGLAAFGLAGPPLLGATALVALAGALAPGLGTLLGAALFVAALAAAGWWWLAIGLGVSGAVVWWFAGRRGLGFAGALATPLLGTAGLTPSAPMLLGFSLPPLRAALLAGYAAALTMVVSAGTGGRAPYIWVDWRYLIDPDTSRTAAGGVRELLATPAALPVIAGWMVAAWLMSIACSRATRGAALLGTMLALPVLFGSYLAADAIARALDASATWSGERLLPQLMASSILVVLSIAAGPPVRAEEE